MRILHVIDKAHAIAVRVFLAPIRLYQRFLSPLKGQPSCRFSPTCSQYCVEAVREWGILIGSALTLWRVLRCNPFGKGGFDPVPRRKRRQRTETEKSPRL